LLGSLAAPEATGPWRRDRETPRRTRGSSCGIPSRVQAETESPRRSTGSRARSAGWHDLLPAARSPPVARSGSALPPRLPTDRTPRLPAMSQVVGSSRRPERIAHDLPDACELTCLIRSQQDHLTGPGLRSWDPGGRVCALSVRNDRPCGHGGRVCALSVRNVDHRRQATNTQHDRHASTASSARATHCANRSPSFRPAT
jgi:hypothetical protein